MWGSVRDLAPTGVSLAILHIRVVVVVYWLSRLVVVVMVMVMVVMVVMVVVVVVVVVIVVVMVRVRIWPAWRNTACKLATLWDTGRAGALFGGTN